MNLEGFRHKFISQDHSANIWLVRRGVYFFVFLYFFLLFPASEYFFGTESLVFGYNMIPDWLDPFFRVLFSNTFGPYYLFFFILLFSLTLLGSLPVLVRWVAPVVYLVAANMFNKAEFIVNGSVAVCLILLFLLIFMSEKKNKEDTKLNYLNSLLTNAAFWFARFQICVVYLTAGVYKLTGEKWIQGEGFYYALNFKSLSQEWFANLFFQSDFLLYTGNYLALFYQLLFPFLVWVRPIKKWFLLVGVFLHASIIVVNGLIDFGTIMLVSYILFLDVQFVSKIRESVSERFRTISGKVSFR